MIITAEIIRTTDHTVDDPFMAFVFEQENENDIRSYRNIATADAVWILLEWVAQFNPVSVEDKTGDAA